MPHLPPSFPELPPEPKRFPPPVKTNIPNPHTPSTRTFHSSTDPLYPPALASANSLPLSGAPAGSTVSRLFQCHCAPKCLDFIKPRDHPELHRIGSVQAATAPLRTRIVASGPPSLDGSQSTQRVKTKFEEFGVDSKVAYEFNSLGFYEELLSQLQHTHSTLLTTHTRSHQFLHATRAKTPAALDPTLPRAYVPYYPSEHLASKGMAFVAPQPLKEASEVAAQIIPPHLSDSGRRRGGRQEDGQTASAAASARFACPVPSHLHVLSNLSLSAPPPALSSSPHSSSSSSSSSSLSSSFSRTQLQQDRAAFAEQLQQQLRAQMTIPLPDDRRHNEHTLQQG